jgi:hypothetical protein
VFILNSVSQSSENKSPQLPQKRRGSLFFGLGLICAFISLLVIPEIFGSVAIILGAYVWKLESGENRSRGLLVVVIGIVAMLMGIYYTSIFGIYNILP